MRFQSVQSLRRAAVLAFALAVPAVAAQEAAALSPITLNGTLTGTLNGTLNGALDRPQGISPAGGIAAGALPAGKAALDRQPAAARLHLAGFSKRSARSSTRSSARSSLRSNRSSVGPRGFNSSFNSRFLQRDRSFGSSAAPTRFGNSLTSGLLRRDRSFGGSSVLRGRTLPLVRGSRLSSTTLFGPRPGGFRRGPFDDSRVRALRAEALALDAEARLRELGLTPAQEAAVPNMPPALKRALALAKEARAQDARARQSAPSEPGGDG
ncbi:hypothetical protein [Pelagibius sp.]|uniref:hypothetical protein n=1 Tax=Pelagibius sp. TaxID=1931238 RepID=UPI003B5033D7